jgi:predicted nucleic acid-binding protein
LNIDEKVYVFDTSALFTFIEDEDGAEGIERLLVAAEKGDVDIHVSFISLTEVFYITLRERGEAEALDRIRLIQSLAVKIQESDENLNIMAGTIKAKHRISLADTYVAALAQYYQATLIHKDPEFEKLIPLIKEYRLPYKV